MREKVNDEPRLSDDVIMFLEQKLPSDVASLLTNMPIYDSISFRINKTKGGLKIIEDMVCIGAWKLLLMHCKWCNIYLSTPSNELNKLRSVLEIFELYEFMNFLNTQITFLIWSPESPTYWHESQLVDGTRTGSRLTRRCVVTISIIIFFFSVTPFFLLCHLLFS